MLEVFAVSAVVKVVMASPAGVENCMAWCEVELYLASLFSFTHLPASNAQSVEHVEGLFSIYERFVQQAVQVGQNPGGANVRNETTSTACDQLSSGGFHILCVVYY